MIRKEWKGKKHKIYAFIYGRGQYGLLGQVIWRTQLYLHGSQLERQTKSHKK